MPTLPNAAPLAGLALRCQPDSRLVGLSREGRTRAFEEIVRRYREPLVSFAGAIVPPHRAEDVVQEALAKAHAALVASQAEVKLKPWLYTIVRNRALNDLRDEPTHEHLDESFDGVLQPPEVAARREQLAALIAQVKDLPPAQRDALVQRELEGRSHREIGVAMGVTPGAVRGLIFRARTALRDAAGMLVPMPALRALLNAGPLGAEATGTGIGRAAVGLTAGGGGGVAAKAGATLAVAVVAIGSGAAIHNRGDNGNDRGATTFASKDHQGVGQGAGGQWGGDGSRSSGRSGDGSGSSSHGGASPSHDSDDSPGSGDSSGRGGGGDDGLGDDDRSDAGGGGGHEGSGGGDEGQEDSVSEGSGSGSGDSGSGDSGSSDSGSSDSGSSDSGSSDSGSSRSGGGGSGDGSSSGSDAEIDADSSGDEALSTDG